MVVLVLFAPQTWSRPAAMQAPAPRTAADDGFTDTPMLPGLPWHVHDPARPHPPIVTPGATLGAPPSDAVVLFDGRDLSRWAHHGTGADRNQLLDPKWPVRVGYFESGQTGSLYTRESFGDVQLHVEWASPSVISGNSQGRGNSGIFLMGLYEIQDHENPVRYRNIWVRRLGSYDRPETAAANDTTVMTSGAFTAAYLELLPQFERATNDKLVTATTTMGTGLAFIPSRLQRGEPADVVIVADDSLRQMIKDGLVLADSRVELARSNIGMAVRAGAPKPDISSVAAFRTTLLQAKSIAYSASVSGVYLTTELFQRLGIADQVLGKSRRIDTERVGAVVARGEAEIGFQQIAELLPVPGIDYVGPLPPEIQKTTVFSAGIAAHSKNANAARALIKFLASPAAAAAITKSGMEPIGSR